MDSLILFSLSTVISLLIHFAFRGVAVAIIKGRKGVVDESIAREDSDLEKNVNRYSRPPRIFIPDVLAGWPWSRRINPHYATIEKEATAWIESFQAFSPKAQDNLNRAKPSLLACLAYPTASKEHVRAGADLMNLLFVFDEYSDKSAPSEVRKQKDVMLDAFRNPHTPRPKGEWIGGEVARQFWEINMQNATKVSQKRFLQGIHEHLNGGVQQSIDREHRHILDIRSYTKERRRTAGMRPLFCIMELGFDIPDEVMSHPVIQEMIIVAIDMIAFCNDMISYNVEQMRGDDLHNIITCVMNEHHTDVNGAMLWVEAHLFGLREKFLAATASLPQWEEPLNTQVKEYCNGLGQWVQGNDDWNFENERYLGNKGLEIKKTRWMSLLPKKSGREVGPMHVDGSLL